MKDQSLLSRYILQLRQSRDYRSDFECVKTVTYWNASLLKIRLHVDLESTFAALRSLEPHKSRKPEGNFKVYAECWLCPIISNFFYNWPHSWGFPKISASHPSWQCWSSWKGHTDPGWGLGLECSDPVVHDTVSNAFSAICLWGTSLNWGPLTWHQ